MTSVAVIHQPVQEMQEHAAVARARAGNIAEHDQRPLADFAVAPRQVDHMAAGAQRLPQGPPHIDALARMVRLEAPREEFAPLQAQARNGRPCACICSASVICSKSLARRMSSADAVKVASSSSTSGFSSRRLCASFWSNMASASRRKPGSLGLSPAGTGDLLEHELHELFQHLRLLPEDMERLVENLLVLAPLHENGMQRPVEFVAACAAIR